MRIRILSVCSAVLMAVSLLAVPAVSQARVRAHHAARAALTDHCVVVPLGSSGLQLTLCFPA